MKKTRLSVIIVNYNVRHFLEQCLRSVLEACEGIEAEIRVVDNNSVDGSVEMIRDKFPEIKLIANTENLGFSKANNQALAISEGEYVLLLNPDTLVESDTFRKCLAFMDAHPDAGGLGVKMIDGKGNFLPESKRGLPTPATAFYKIFGLAKLFPKSRLFGRYHLGYLDENETHEVDILSGAFMLMRSDVLKKTGFLDETFFMYGEDIDMSWRIREAGWKNYYFPHTRIIHYKGESTKKSSVNYVFTFYNAMIIFARKHFTSKNASMISMLIHLAIYVRAFAAILSRFLQQIFLPLSDALLLYGGILLIEHWWEAYIFPWGGHYPPSFTFLFIPGYIAIWLFTAFLSGGYDKPISLSRMLRGLTLGTLIILVLYSLLEESMRYSRALILLGYLWAVLIIPLFRWFLHHTLASRQYRLGSSQNKRFVIVGEKEEAERVAAIVKSAHIQPSFIGLVSIEEEKNPSSAFIGRLSQLPGIIEIYAIDEVIFCSKDISTSSIIDQMAYLQSREVDLKIAPPESLSIIGSKSISTSGDLYIMDINSITRQTNTRKKFFFDFFLSFLLLGIFPIALFIVRKPLGYLRNILLVMLGLRSWVGFCLTGKSNQRLPGIRSGILNPTDALGNKNLDQETIEKLNLLYARDYKVSYDINIVFNGFRNTGRRI